MTFDDGLSTQYDYAFPLLQAYDLKATFFIITNYLGYGGYMDGTDLSDLVNDGQEIGSHTKSHPDLTGKKVNLPNELLGSQSTLQGLSGQDVATLAYPYGSYNSTVIAAADNYYIAARTTNSNALNAASPGFYALNIIWPNENGTSNVVPHLQYWVDRAIAESKWAIEMYHDIEIEGYDTVSSEDLNAHFNYLAANEADVWVAPMGYVCEYIYERNAASITTLESNSNFIRLDLSCGLNSRFNTPLTLLTACPAGWESDQIHVRQGQMEQTAEIVFKNGVFYMMYNAFPDTEPIELLRSQQTYTLNISAGLNGSIDPSGTMIVNYGSSQGFTATPDVGYEVDQWLIDDLSVQIGGTDYTLADITANHTVHVDFVPYEYSFTVTRDGNGTVTVDPVQVTYHYGDTVTLTALADAGWTFDSWGGILSGSTNPAVVTITDNTTVNATFTQNEYTLTVNAVGSGTVTPDPVQAAYHYGDTVTLTALADAGWTFDSWGEVLSGSTNPAVVTLTDNTTVMAAFMPLTYTVTASAGLNGVIDPNGIIMKNYGSSQVFSATADAGYEVEAWVVDSNEVQTGGAAYMLNNITADYTVLVTFKPLVYTISGYCIESDGVTPLEGVQIQTNTDANTVTDANGFYALWVDYGWSGTVKPEKDGYIFDPNRDEYITVTQDYINANYIAEFVTFKITGCVLEPDLLRPISDVNVIAENGGGPWTSRYSSGDSVTDANGFYELTVDYNWSGRVMPTKYAYAFEPSYLQYADVLEDQNGQDYTGELMTYAVSGTIRNDCGVPISGVQVSADNGGGSALTDPNGFYEVWVSYNWSGTVTPGNKAHYTFTLPQTIYADVLGDISDQDYFAENVYDLDCDGLMAVGDLQILCDNWLMTGPAVRGDFYKNEDNSVNFLDFAEFSNIWLSE